MKRKWAKAFVFVAAMMANVPMWHILTIPVLQGRLPSPPPTWAIALLAVSAVVLLLGLLLGSRGVGKPLTARIMFRQLLAFPCCLPVGFYLLGFATAIVVNLVRNS